MKRLKRNLPKYLNGTPSPFNNVPPIDNSLEGYNYNQNSINLPNFTPFIQQAGYNTNPYNQVSYNIPQTEPIVQSIPYSNTVQYTNPNYTPWQLPTGNSDTPNYSLREQLTAVDTEALRNSGYITPANSMPQTVDTVNSQSNNQPKRGGFYNFLNSGTPLNVDLPTSAYTAGKMLAINPSNYTNPEARRLARSGKTMGLIGSFGKLGLGSLRLMGQGAGDQNRYEEVMSDYYDNQRYMQNRGTTNYGIDTGNYTQQFEQGGQYGKGELKTTSSSNQQTSSYGLSKGDVLTGRYATGVVERQANAEVENKEVLMTPDGEVRVAVGNTHSQGGIPVQMVQGEIVLSNKKEIGVRLAKKLNKDYDLKLKASNSYAEANTKYTKKIGLQKLIDEEAKWLKKIDKTDTGDKATDDMNKAYLSENIQNIRDKRNPLEQQESDFVIMLFEKQTGKPYNPYPQQEQPQVNPINELVNAYAQVTQQDPNSIMQQLNELPEQEVVKILSEMEQSLQATPEQGEVASSEEVLTEEQPEFEDGGMFETKEFKEYASKYNMTLEQAKELVGKYNRQVAYYALPKTPYEGDPPYDQGYLATTAPIKRGDYIPIITPSGRSVLGGQGVKGEVWNPGSVEAVQWFLQNAETQAKYDPEYSQKLASVKDALSKATTDQERFKILNTQGQADRQVAFESRYPNVNRYRALKETPNQTGIQTLLNSLEGSKKKELEDTLKESGVEVKDGKVLGGFYKYSQNYSSESKLGKFINKINEEEPQVFDKYSNSLNVDKVWDRRVQKLHNLDFRSELERDAYAKEQGFITKDNVWLDPNNINNIIVPRVFRDKKVTPEELKEYEANKNLSDVEGYKGFNKPYVYEKWITDSVNQTADQKLDRTVDVNIKQNPLNNLKTRVPTYDPNYIAPTALEPAPLYEDRPYLTSSIKQDTIPLETKYTQQMQTLATQLQGTPDTYTTGALITAQANQEQNLNEAWQQINLANQGRELEAMRLNNQAYDTMETRDQSFADDYFIRTATASAKYDEQSRRYFEALDQTAIDNAIAQEKMNLLSNLNNYRYVNGQLVRTADTELYLNSLNKPRYSITPNVSDEKADTTNRKTRTKQ